METNSKIWEKGENTIKTKEENETLKKWMIKEEKDDDRGIVSHSAREEGQKEEDDDEMDQV